MDDAFTLTLVLVERDRSRIREVAESVSDPDHPRYGRHLTRDELADLVLLPAEDVQWVLDWATVRDLSVLGAAQRFIRVSGTESAIREAFGPELVTWLENGPATRGGRLGLALPRELQSYVLKVDAIPGQRGRAGGTGAVTQLPNVAIPVHEGRPAVGDAGPAAAPDDLLGLTPADIRRVYSVPSELDGSGETIAVMALGRGEIADSDNASFWLEHGVEPPEVDYVDLGPQTEHPASPVETLETAMAVQWIGAMAPGARIVVYRIDPAATVDPWGLFLLEVVHDADRAPTVATTSWVTPERHYYPTHGHALIAGLLDQAAALGVTVLSASGDWGAFDGAPRVVQDGRYVCDAPWPHGIFPAVEERVLSVGGTTLLAVDPLTEVAWTALPPLVYREHIPLEQWASSGGFSAEVPIPVWQKRTLRPYYSRGAGTPAVVPYGRGFPDVALAAGGPLVQRRPGDPLESLGFQCVFEGQWIDWAGGTSLAAPIWAAFVALVNQARRTAGLGRAGFVNPLLYRLAQDREAGVFREITAGESDVTMKAIDVQGRATTYRMSGFDCRAGWNPVTGLGAPDLSRLVAALTRVGAASQKGAQGRPSA